MDWTWCWSDQARVSRKSLSAIGMRSGMPIEAQERKENKGRRSGTFFITWNLRWSTRLRFGVLPDLQMEMEMARKVIGQPPTRPHQQTVAERSARLGATGEPAGDVEAIVDQQVATDEKTTRRRAKLIHEVKEASSQSDLDPLDELVDKTTGKTVDDLIK